jgi:DNA-binding transcriptional regulator YdaS (Cro superfamily)
MASDQIHREILQRAAKIAGGEDKLAQRLHARSEDMHEWVEGRATAPAGIYIMALDILSRSRSSH